MKPRIVCLLFLGALALTFSAGGVAQDKNEKKVEKKKIDKPIPAEEQLKLFSVPKDFEVELVAAEPLVINPITMTLDEKGRIYVSESHTYRYGPSGSPIKPFTNPIVRLDPLPDGKGYKRVIVAEGFDEPVMGLAIRDGKLWCTANNFLVQFDLAEDGKATNKRVLLTDKNKAWNPFGMFVLEWGPDGLLYMSVGNHSIDIGGPTNRVSGRGSSGIVCRMKPDGSDLQRLVHGLRVPYSYEFDPFGQLWVLSNGEGNPDRFVKVIDGVDYHCYSRGNVDNEWLAGRHALAPPCFELGRGAHTQLIRYYGAGFPADYQGSLLLDNWGAHGFNGANRAVFRFVPDEHGNIVKQEMFVSCTDPHFRPSHIIVDPDGNLLIADWYGRDDESDLTGRIWRVKYKGKDKPVVTHQRDGAAWAGDDYAVSALGSPDHIIREKAINELIARGNRVVPKLTAYAAEGKEALGSANALWVLLRIGTPESRAAIASGAKNADGHVRRLAVNLLRRYQIPGAAEVAKKLIDDADLAVRVEAAQGLPEPAAIRTALLSALEQGAAKDRHLRYEAAWHLARHADANALTRLLSSPDHAVRVAGLIAMDIACYEATPVKDVALETLARWIQDMKGSAAHIDQFEPELLLTLAQLNGDKAVLSSLEKAAVRDDLPPAITARALLVLRAKAGNVAQPVIAAAGKRFLEAVAKGTVKLSTSSDQLLLIDLLETEGPTDFTLKQLGGYLNGSTQVRPAAHALARKFGAKAAPLAPALWPRVNDSKAKLDDRVEALATLARIEATPVPASWERLLADPDPFVRAEAVRWWRSFKGRAEWRELLAKRAPDLVKEDASLKDDLALVLAHLEVAPDVLKNMGLSTAETSKDVVTEQTLAALPKLAPADRQKRALLGKQVFERTGCTKCHTAVTQDTPLAPSLKGIATAQKIDYLIESVLYPSKVIKTGFETELILTKDGKSVTGLVKDEGTTLRVLNLDKEVRIAKKDIEERSIQKISIMPEGQEKLMSRQEFVDLMCYLLTLK
jgi:putative membrane-bound dehydrogenase-like protein